MNLDELIERAISMASNVGKTKRKQQWDMAREEQGAQMARTQLQESGATTRTGMQETGAMERTRLTDIGATARQRLGDQARIQERGIIEGGLNTRQGLEFGQQTREREATQGFNRESFGLITDVNRQEAEAKRRADIHQTVLKSILGSKDDLLSGQGDEGYKTKVSNIALRGIGQKPFPPPTDPDAGLSEKEREKKRKRLLEAQSIGK